MKIGNHIKGILRCILILQFTIFLNSCDNAPKEANAEQASKPKELSKEEMEIRGEYLTTVGGCNDCHSPKNLTKEGPVVDASRRLSGSPSGNKLARIDQEMIKPGNWYLGSADLTTWVGPWGISFAANLTPDSSTGIGAWSEDLFIKILRTGKFMGIESGRPIMPPMPWEEIRKLTDEDLKCIFAYLKSLPPIMNAVPAYIPPDELMSMK